MAKVDARAEALRSRRIAETGTAVPDKLQGVTKHKVREVLGRISINHPDLIEGVYALLDDETDSWMQKVPKDAKFADGATTAQIACHIGILQRGGTKLDREGRDYWIKPLRDVGGIEAVYLHNGQFLAGHPKAKSPLSAYKLEDGFRAILTAPDGMWQDMLAKWTSEDVKRHRLEFQAKAAESAKSAVGNSHENLIDASVKQYASKFLPGFEVLYVDDSDGERVSPEEAQAMSEAGVELTLGDAWPDVLLWNPRTDRLWVIEAVTSDGEVDTSKVAKMTDFARRHGKAGIDFTTTYLTWRDAAARQGTHRNIAVGTYMWIQADPSKHFLVGSFDFSNLATASSIAS